MSTLCGYVGENFKHIAIKEAFFSEQDLSLIDRSDNHKKAEINLFNCSEPAFIGTFFDGTGNSYRSALDTKKESESNIARLYDAFPGRCVPGILPPETEWKANLDQYKHYFKLYIPGVGKRFDSVGDQTHSWARLVDEGLGVAFGRLGQARIYWALAQLLNYIYQHYHTGAGSSILIPDEEIQRISAKVNLLHSELSTDAETALSINGAITPSMPTAHRPPLTHRPPTYPVTAVFYDWLTRLKQCIGNDDRRPGVTRLNTLHLYTFGFSRGASQSRVYLNWLLRMCRVDALMRGETGGPYSLAGIPVVHEFMGIFDTVASLGIPNMVDHHSGHDFWSDAKSLQIPKEVGKCLHFVSAHEQRRSFPLDSAYQGQRLPDYCEEVVFPGVHSDIGGGYSPLDQGKGLSRDGATTLQRIALAEMYRRARVAGVPLILEKASATAQEGYRIDPRLIQAFNDYLACFNVKEGTTGEIVKEHWLTMTRWRLRGVSSAQWPSGSRERAEHFDQPLRQDIAAQRAAITHDMAMLKQDIGAGHRAENDAKRRALRDKLKRLNQSEDALYVDRLNAAAKTQRFGLKLLEGEFDALRTVRRSPTLMKEQGMSVYTARVVDRATGTAKDQQCKLRPDEREEVRVIFHEMAHNFVPVDARVAQFLDNYVHDSIAGFSKMINERSFTGSFVYFRFRRIFSGSDDLYQVPYSSGFAAPYEEHARETEALLRVNKPREALVRA